MSDITEAQLLSALQAAYDRPDGPGLTSRELSQQLGCGTKTLFRIMDNLPGTFETVWVFRLNRAGIRARVPAYRLKGDSNEQL